MKCWGSNWLGELGSGASGPSSTPLDVPGLTGATSISARPYHHTCALIAGGSVKCVGSNSVGELGDGTTATAWTPVTMVGVAGVSAVTLGYGHSCVIVAGGTVACRGSNNFGQLGDDTLVPSIDPVQVRRLTGATAVSAGYEHTCALRADTKVTCWGFNRSGQLGRGFASETARSNEVVAGT